MFNPDQNTLFYSYFSDRLGYDNDFAWEEARYPGSRNGLTHFRRLEDKILDFDDTYNFHWIFSQVVCELPLQLWPSHVPLWPTKLRAGVQDEKRNQGPGYQLFWGRPFLNLYWQVLIKPGLIVYKGTKSVVEFLVNNYTIVDAGGNRDTKKVY